MTDTKLHEETVTLDRPHGKIPLFVAAPADGGKYPAVIVVHEIFGLNDHIKSVARRFAQHKITAFAPDLFAYSSNLPQDRNDLNAMRSVWQAIPDSQLIGDLQSVFEYAQRCGKSRPDKIGAIGYCMGGAIAYMFACETPAVAWVADYYGRIFYPQLSDTKPKHPIDYTEKLKAPVLGLFAGKDELITDEQIKTLDERLTQQKNKHDIKVYSDAQHAFFNDQREFYHPQAAEDAWKRTLAFIEDAVKVSIAR